MRIIKINVIYLSIYWQVVRNYMADVALFVGLWLGVNIDVHQVENRDHIIYAVRNSLIVNIRGPGRSQRPDEKSLLWNNFLLEQWEHVVFVFVKIITIWRKNWLSTKLYEYTWIFIKHKLLNGSFHVDKNLLLRKFLLYRVSKRDFNRRKREENVAEVVLGRKLEDFTRCQRSHVGDWKKYILCRKYWKILTKRVKFFASSIVT